MLKFYKTNWPFFLVSCCDSSGEKAWIKKRHHSIRPQIYDHKYDLEVIYGDGIPSYILNKQKKYWLEKGAISKEDLQKLKFSVNGKIKKIPVQNLPQAKKIAKEIIDYYNHYHKNLKWFLN